MQSNIKQTQTKRVNHVSLEIADDEHQNKYTGEQRGMQHIVQSNVDRLEVNGNVFTCCEQIIIVLAWIITCLIPIFWCATFKV